MRRTFPQAFGTGNHLVDSFHVLFPRRKAQKFVITPKMLQLCALYDSASVVQWIERQIPVLLIWVRFPSGVLTEFFERLCFAAFGGNEAISGVLFLSQPAPILSGNFLIIIIPFLQLCAAARWSDRLPQLHDSCQR